MKVFLANLLRSGQAKNALILFLSAVLPTQPVLAALSESHLWAERRETIEKADRQNQPTQLASLPSALNPQSILKQLPAVNTTLPTLSKWSGSNRGKSLGLTKKLQTLVDSIPLIYGSIQEIYDSGDTKIAPVVLIQDVHLNPEAQTNIAGILQELIDQKQVGLVGVEGAFDPFDFSRFRAFPDKKITKDVSDAFLQKNLLAAPSYVGITSPMGPPTFMGVDDLEHYRMNVRAYLTTLKIKEKVKKEIVQDKIKLSEMKTKVFSPELRGFDDLRMAYHQGNIGFGTYVKKITTLNDGRWSTVDGRGDDFVIAQFLEAFEMESTLDFKRVDEERKIVLEKLTKVLSEKELSDLLAGSVAYRMGRISFGVYYQNLKELCATKGVSLRNAPAFDNYIRYVLLCDGIKPDKLFANMGKLEESILDALAKTPEEKDLAAASEHLNLTEKLIEFSLTPIEWEKYSSFRTAVSQTDPESSSIKINKSKDTGSPITNFGDDDLKPFEQFYVQADIRSQKMTANLLSSSSSNVSIEDLASFASKDSGFPIRTFGNDGARVLVTGGFHSPQIAQILREQKTSYLIVSPKITKVDSGSGSEYLSIFARDKSSLDQLFKGEKLFLTPAEWIGVGGALGTKTRAVSFQTEKQWMTRRGGKVQPLPSRFGRWKKSWPPSGQWGPAFLIGAGRLWSFLILTVAAVLWSGSIGFSGGLAVFVRALWRMQNTQFGLKDSKRLKMVMSFYRDVIKPFGVKREDGTASKGGTFGVQTLLSPAAEEIAILDRGGGVVSKEFHEGVNREIASVLRRLENDSRVGKQIQKLKSDDGEIYFRGLFGPEVKRLRTEFGEIRLEPDDAVVIIDPRFPLNHAGRDRFIVFARTEFKAQHELTELRGWRDYAFEKEIIFEEEIEAHLLGTVIKEWIKGERGPPPTAGLLQDLVNQFHMEGLKAELIAESPELAKLPSTVWNQVLMTWKGNEILNRQKFRTIRSHLQDPDKADAREALRTSLVWFIPGEDVHQVKAPAVIFEFEPVFKETIDLKSIPQAGEKLNWPEHSKPKVWGHIDLEKYPPRRILVKLDSRLGPESKEQQLNLIQKRFQDSGITSTVVDFDSKPPESGMLTHAKPLDEIHHVLLLHELPSLNEIKAHISLFSTLLGGKVIEQLKPLTVRFEDEMAKYKKPKVDKARRLYKRLIQAAEDGRQQHMEASDGENLLPQNPDILIASDESSDLHQRDLTFPATPAESVDFWLKTKISKQGAKASVLRVLQQKDVVDFKDFLLRNKGQFSAPFIGEALSHLVRRILADICEESQEYLFSLPANAARNSSNTKFAVFVSGSVSRGSSYSDVDFLVFPGEEGPSSIPDIHPTLGEFSRNLKTEIRLRLERRGFKPAPQDTKNFSIPLVRNHIQLFAPATVRQLMDMKAVSGDPETLNRALNFQRELLLNLGKPGKGTFQESADFGKARSKIFLDIRTFLASVAYGSKPPDRQTALRALLFFIYHQRIIFGIPEESNVFRCVELLKGRSLNGQQAEILKSSYDSLIAKKLEHKELSPTEQEYFVKTVLPILTQIIHNPKLDSTTPPASIFYRHQLGRLRGEPHNRMLAWMGDPVTGGPALEVVFNLTVPYAMHLAPDFPIFAILVWLMSALLFAKAHADRSPPEQKTLFFMGLIFGLPFFISGLNIYQQTFVSILIHSLYNLSVLNKRLPSWMPVASIVRKPNNDVAWFNRSIDIKLPEERFRQNHVKIEEKLDFLMNALGRAGKSVDRDNLADINIGAYLSALQHSENVFRDTGLNADRFEEIMLKFQSEMMLGKWGWSGYGDMRASRVVERLINKMFSPTEQEGVQQDPIQYAARMFVAIVQAQAFHNGNHRVADFVLNFILIKNGLNYFVLTPKNVLRYYMLLSTDDLQKGKFNIDEITEFFRKEIAKSRINGKNNGTHAKRESNENDTPMKKENTQRGQAAARDMAREFSGLGQEQKINVLKELNRAAEASEPEALNLIRVLSKDLEENARHSRDTALILEISKALGTVDPSLQNIVALLRSYPREFREEVFHALALEANFGDLRSFRVLWRILVDPKSAGESKAIIPTAGYLTNFIQNFNLSLASITRNDLNKLSQANDASLQRAIFINVVQPLFFRRPDLFDDRLIRGFINNYGQDVPEVKYLDFYRRADDQKSSPDGSDLFPLQEIFRDKMAKGKKKVLIWYNLKAGLGDELIRTATLIQALIDLNPEIEVTVYSGRPFIYSNQELSDGNGKKSFVESHPQLKYRDLRESPVPSGDETFDLVVTYTEGKQTFDTAKESLFRDWMKERPSAISISTVMDKTLLFKIKIGDIERAVPSSVEENEYTPVYRLCAELGLPFRVGRSRFFSNPFSIFGDSRSADDYWNRFIEPKRQGKPVVIFNGVGGESVEKGYGASEKDWLELKEDVSRFINAGFFVLLLTNGKGWGSRDSLKAVIRGLEAHVEVAPSPVGKTDMDPSSEFSSPYLYKYLLSRANLIYTVEGGTMHFAWQVSRAPMIVRLFPDAGLSSEWIPIGMGPDGGVVYRNLDTAIKRIQNSAIGSHLSAVALAKEEGDKTGRPGNPASIFYRHYLARQAGQPHHRFFAWMGDPVAGAPVLEVVFNLTVPLSFHLAPGLPILGMVVWVFSNLVFAKFHVDRSPPEQKTLFFMGLVFGLPFFIPGLDLITQTYISFFLHGIFNHAVLEGWLPKWMPVAMIPLNTRTAKEMIRMMTEVKGKSEKELIELLGNKGSDLYFKGEVIDSLLKFPSPNAFKALKRAARDKEPVIRMRAVQILTHFAQAGLFKDVSFFKKGVTGEEEPIRMSSGKALHVLMQKERAAFEKRLNSHHLFKDSILALSVADAEFGSGFVFGEDQNYFYLFTNTHVVGKNSSLKAWLGTVNKSKSVNGQVVVRFGSFAADRYQNDIAVVAINKKDCQAQNIHLKPLTIYNDPTDVRLKGRPTTLVSGFHRLVRPSGIWIGWLGKYFTWANGEGEKGDSGSPVFMEIDGAPRVVAVWQGYYTGGLGDHILLPHFQRWIEDFKDARRPESLDEEEDRFVTDHPELLQDAVAALASALKPARSIRDAIQPGSNGDASTARPASIPSILLSDLATSKSFWGRFTYFALTVIVAPILETWAFQYYGPLSSAGFLWATIGFAAAHTIVVWIARAIQIKRGVAKAGFTSSDLKADLLQTGKLTLLGAFFTSSFLVSDSPLRTIIVMHAAVNTFVVYILPRLIGRSREGLLTRKFLVGLQNLLPLARIVPPPARWVQGLKSADTDVSRGPTIESQPPAADQALSSEELSGERTQLIPEKFQPEPLTEKDRLNRLKKKFRESAKQDLPIRIDLDQTETSPEFLRNVLALVTPKANFDLEKEIRIPKVVFLGDSAALERNNPESFRLLQQIQLTLTQLKMRKLTDQGFDPAIDISDQHANPHFLRTVLKLVQEGKVKRVLFHGDLFDRGPKNLECLALVQKIQKLLGDQFAALLGNHDVELIRAILLGDEDDFLNWLAHDPQRTFLKEIGVIKFGKNELIKTEQEFDELLNEHIHQYVEGRHGRRGNPKFFNDLFKWARENESLRNTALWLVQNGRMLYTDELGNIHVHAGIPADNQGNVVFNGKTGEAAVKALYELNASWENLRKNLTSFRSFGQKKNLVGDHLAQADSLFWTRGNDWYDNFMITDAEVEKVLAERVAAAEAERAVGVKYESDAKLQNYEIRQMRAQIYAEKDRRPEPKPEILSKFLNQLGARGLFFGHEHKTNFENIANRLFCLDADGSDGGKGFLRSMKGGLYWATEGQRRGRKVLDKDVVIEQLLDEAIKLKKSLGLKSGREELRQKQILAKLNLTARDPREVFRNLIPDIKEFGAEVYRLRRLVEKGEIEEAVNQRERLYSLNRALNAKLDAIKALSRSSNNSARYSFLIDRLNNAVGIAPVTTWESFPNQRIVLSRVLPLATIPEHIAVLLEIFESNPSYIDTIRDSRNNYISDPSGEEVVRRVEEKYRTRSSAGVGLKTPPAANVETRTGSHLSSVALAKEEGGPSGRPGNPASILFRHYLARLKGEPHSPILAWMGDPLTGAPVLEVVFQLMIPLMVHLLPAVPFIGIFIWLMSALLFAASHTDRSPPQKQALFFMGLIFGLPFFFTGLDIYSQTLLSVFIHSLYNYRVLIGKLPQWMPVAAIFKASWEKNEINLPNEMFDMLNLCDLPKDRKEVLYDDIYAGKIKSVSDLEKRIKEQEGQLWVDTDEREEHFLKLGIYRGKMGEYYEVNVGWTERYSTLPEDVREIGGIWSPCITYADAMYKAGMIEKHVKNPAKIPLGIIEPFPAEAKAFDQLSVTALIQHIKSKKINMKFRDMSIQDVIGFQRTHDNHLDRLSHSNFSVSSDPTLGQVIWVAQDRFVLTSAVSGVVSRNLATLSFFGVSLCLTVRAKRRTVEGPLIDMIGVGHFYPEGGGAVLEDVLTQLSKMEGLSKIELSINYREDRPLSKERRAALKKKADLNSMSFSITARDKDIRLDVLQTGKGAFAIQQDAKKSWTLSDMSEDHVTRFPWGPDVDAAKIPMAQVKKKGSDSWSVTSLIFKALSSRNPAWAAELLRMAPRENQLRILQKLQRRFGRKTKGDPPQGALGTISAKVDLGEFLNIITLRAEEFNRQAVQWVKKRPDNLKRGIVQELTKIVVGLLKSKSDEELGLAAYKLIDLAETDGSLNPIVESVLKQNRVDPLLEWAKGRFDFEQPVNEALTFSKQETYWKGVAATIAVCSRTRPSKDVQKLIRLLIATADPSEGLQPIKGEIQGRPRAFDVEQIILRFFEFKVWVEERSGVESPEMSTDIDQLVQTYKEEYDESIPGISKEKFLRCATAIMMELRFQRIPLPGAGAGLYKLRVDASNKKSRAEITSLVKDFLSTLSFPHYLRAKKGALEKVIISNLFSDNELNHSLDPSGSDSNTAGRSGTSPIISAATKRLPLIIAICLLGLSTACRFVGSAWKHPKTQDSSQRGELSPETYIQKYKVADITAALSRQIEKNQIVGIGTTRFIKNPSEYVVSSVGHFLTNNPRQPIWIGIESEPRATQDWDAYATGKTSNIPSKVMLPGAMNILRMAREWNSRGGHVRVFGFDNRESNPLTALKQDEGMAGLVMNVATNNPDAKLVLFGGRRRFEVNPQLVIDGDKKYPSLMQVLKERMGTQGAFSTVVIDLNQEDEKDFIGGLFYDLLSRTTMSDQAAFGLFDFKKSSFEKIPFVSQEKLDEQNNADNLKRTVGNPGSVSDTADGIIVRPVESKPGPQQKGQSPGAILHPADGANRLANLIQAVSEGRVADAINAFPEEPIHVSDMGGSGKTQSEPPLLKIQKWLSDPEFIALFEKALREKGVKWSDEREEVERLKIVFLGLGLNNQKVQAVLTDLKANADRVFVFNEKEREDRVMEGFVKAGAATETPIRVLVKQGKGLEAYYENLVTRMRGYGFKGPMEVRTYSDELLTEEGLDPLVLESEGRKFALVSGFQLDNILLVLPGEIPIKNMGQPGVDPSKLEILLRNIQSFEKFAASNNVQHTVDLVRAALLAA